MPTSVFLAAVSKRGMSVLGVVYISAVQVGLVFQSCHGDEITTAESPVVQTSYGPVRGYSFTSSWTNQTIYAFHGIPYASPPVGDLRFKDPVQPEKWTSILDCTKDRDSCMQSVDPILIHMNLTFTTSEDCLFLNVYTPEIKQGKLPVMVWVHGGAFLSGSGSRFRYGPDFLVAEGVVVVTLNYRLGAFGFMSLGTSEIPGNAGLKDQLLALQWVQREISNFGGDPGEVTLFGESSGSASVHLHYISPLSKGIFHRVIGESGASLSWAVRQNGTAYGLRVASALNCSLDTPLSIHKCLRAAPAEEILKAQRIVKSSENDSKDGVQLVFVPTVDKLHSEKPFLPDMPKEMIRQKMGSSVPFVMGVNSHEGIMMLFKGDSFINKTTNNLDSFIPREVREKSSSARILKLVENIKSFYFKDSNTQAENIRGFIDLYTDTVFGYNTAISAKYFRERSPVYLYWFAFYGMFKESMAKMIQTKYNISGVAHAEEMSYLFVRRKVNQTAAADSREMKTWKRMARLWTNFAKFGTPTVGADPLLQNVTWSPVGKVSTGYLRIDDNLTMETTDFLGPAVALWDSVTTSDDNLDLPVATEAAHDII